MDGYQTELGRARVLSRLAMYEGLLRSLSARAAYARELVEAAGMDWEQWLAIPLSRVEEREAVLRKGKRVLRRAGLHP